jgi:hypothetical protein
MRKPRAAASYALLLPFLVLGPTRASTPFDLVEAFVDVCLETLPDFDGASDRLGVLGHELSAHGEDLYSFHSDELGLKVTLAVGASHEPGPSCEFRSDLVTQGEALDVVDAHVIVGWPEAAFDYAYEDHDSAGWRIPTGTGTLTIWVGRSIHEMDHKGVSIGVLVGR